MADDQPQSEPETGLGGSGRHHPAALPSDLAGRRADRCRRPAPAPDRGAGRHGRHFDRLRGGGFGRAREPPPAALDVVPDRPLRSVHGARVAAHHADPRSEVRTRQRDRDRHLSLQCRARGRTGDRRIRDRGLQHRRPVLVLLRRQSHPSHGPGLVARAAKAEGDPAGRTADQRDDGRGALRSLQPRDGRDGHSRNRLLPLRQRLSRLAAAGRAKPEGRRGGLWPADGGDRPRLDRGHLRASLAEGAARPERAGRPRGRGDRRSRSFCSPRRASR